jgi:hypothetical protein
MSCTTDQVNQIRAGASSDFATLFVSLELSNSKWLATVLSPGSAKMSKHVVAGGDWNALLALVLQASARAETRVGVCSCVRRAVIRRTSAAVAIGGRSTAAVAAPCGHAAKRSETPAGATRAASAAGGCTPPEWAATGPGEKE